MTTTATLIAALATIDVDAHVAGLVERTLALCPVGPAGAHDTWPRSSCKHCGLGMLTAVVVAVLGLGCAPRQATGYGDAGETDTGDAGETWPAGDAWGPCPTDQGTSLPTLCNGIELACVPADFAESNMCLPLGACPAFAPFGSSVELGWGDACYPRCNTSEDCGPGLVCASAVADGLKMCAWPR